MIEKAQKFLEDLDKGYQQSDYCLECHVPKDPWTDARRFSYIVQMTYLLVVNGIDLTDFLNAWMEAFPSSKTNDPIAKWRDGRLINKVCPMRKDVVAVLERLHEDDDA